MWQQTLTCTPAALFKHSLYSFRLLVDVSREFLIWRTYLTLNGISCIWLPAIVGWVVGTALLHQEQWPRVGHDHLWPQAAGHHRHQDQGHGDCCLLVWKSNIFSAYLYFATHHRDVDARMTRTGSVSHFIHLSVDLLLTRTDQTSAGDFADSFCILF